MVDSRVLPKLREKLESQNPDHPAWRYAADRVLEYSRSKAPTKVDEQRVSEVVVRLVEE